MAGAFWGGRTRGVGAPFHLTFPGSPPAPPASDACAGHQRQGARHGRSAQEFDLLRRHRRWQEFVPRRGSRWGRRHRAAAEVVAGPGGSTVREYAALSDRDGGLRGRASSQPQDARLMPARYVRPYSKGQKNDFRDAEAIAEAVQRPTMRFVATKTAEQLDLQGLHRVRERLAVCPSITDLSEMRRHDKDHAGLLPDIAEAFLHGFEHKTQPTEPTCRRSRREAAARHAEAEKGTRPRRNDILP